MTDQAGTAWVFGDTIDTDQLAPGAYLKEPIEVIAQHCLERVNLDFAGQVAPGDVVVGGRYFGIGSSREQAAQALKELGVAAVVATSFGGIFYRNALNFGLLALVCPRAGEIAQGDRIAVDPVGGVVRNLTRDEHYDCEPIPAHLLEMVEAGGLVAYLERTRAAAADG